MNKRMRRTEKKSVGSEKFPELNFSSMCNNTTSL